MTIDTSPEALSKLRADLSQEDGIFAVPMIIDTMVALIDEIKELRASEASWKAMAEYWENMCRAVVTP